MSSITLAVLRDAVADQEVAAARITTIYQPAGGPGSRIYPPTFPADRTESPYLVEKRMCGGEPRVAVVLDQVPSQANRAEEALKHAWEAGRLRMPMLRLTNSGAASAVVTGLDAPHRAFDAYWRDSMIDGEKFDKSEIGKALQQATLQDASALLRYDPATLVYGGWNSHRKGKQEKFPRLYASEMVGWDPVVGERKAGRMDPLNLTGSRSGEGDAWAYSTSAAKNAKAKLSEIGHGNIAPNSAHGGVTVTKISRFATLSLTALRRVRFGAKSEEAQEAARTLLAAFALLADRLAFGAAGVWLRSGCDLVAEEETLEWVRRGGVTEAFTLAASDSLALYEEALEAALAVGVPIHLDTVEVAASPALSKAIDFSLTKAESTGE